MNVRADIRAESERNPCGVTPYPARPVPAREDARLTVVPKSTLTVFGEQHQSDEPTP